MKRTYIILLLVILGILAGTFFFIREWNRKPTNTANEKPDYTLTTADLLNEFKKDTAEAHKKFSPEKVIQVSGSPDEVEARDSTVNVVFHGDGAALTCGFRGNPADLKKIASGQQMTFKGKYSGYQYNDIFMQPEIELKECVLVQDKK
jgi:hypothetical protein